MKITAKQLVCAAFITVLAAAAWQSLVSDGVSVNFDGEQFDGPLGLLIGMLMAGGGLLIGTVAIVCATIFTGMLFASLGILMITGMMLLVVVGVAAVSPLLLPLLIPVGIYAIVRARKQRRHAAFAAAV